MLGIESSRPDNKVAKIGSKAPLTKRVKVRRYFQGLIINPMSPGVFGNDNSMGGGGR